MFFKIFVVVVYYCSLVPIEKLFAWGEGIVEDTCYEIPLAEACVD